MNTWVKILIGGLAVIVLLAVIALGVVRLTFDPAAYRAKIDSAVSQAVGRPVTINGPIGVSIFPWLSIRFGDVRVANAAGFDDRPMAHIDTANLSLRLLPMMIGEVRLGTLSLDGVSLRLTRRANGQSNWQSMVHRLADKRPAGRPAGAPARRRAELIGTLPVSSLRVGAVEVGGARIRYDDDAAGRHYRFTNANLQTGRISNGHPFRLEIGGDLRWPDTDLTAAIHLVSLIEPNVSDRFYRFSGLSVNVLASGSAVPGGRQEANLGASGDLDMEAGRFALDDVSLQGAGLTLTGKIDGDGLNDRLNYNGRITVGEFSPRSVMQQLELHPPRTQASSALTDASFDAQFEGGADVVHFKQIVARLDESTLTGTVDIHDPSEPRYGFDLNLDTLALDDYLPPGSATQAETSQPAETGGGAAQKAAEFDLALLRHLQMHGRLSIGSLTAVSLNITNAVAELSANHDVLRVAPLTADLYGGSVRLEGSVDAGAARPQYRLDGWARRVGVEPLLVDAIDSHRLQGTGSAEVDLHAQGRQVAQLKRSLSGRIGFALTDGQINDIDLPGMLLAASAQSHGQTRDTSRTGTDKTAFRRLSGRFDIDHGIATGDDLVLALPGLTGRGRGRYSLPKNELNYTLTAVVPDRAGGELAPLAGWRVPVHLHGPLLAAESSVDMQAATRTEANPSADQGSGQGAANDANGNPAAPAGAAPGNGGS